MTKTPDSPSRGQTRSRREPRLPGGFPAGAVWFTLPRKVYGTLKRRAKASKIPPNWLAKYWVTEAMTKGWWP